MHAQRSQRYLSFTMENSDFRILINLKYLDLLESRNFKQLTYIFELT
jgi:hypothetical protein